MGLIRLALLGLTFASISSALEVSTSASSPEMSKTMAQTSAKVRVNGGQTVLAQSESTAQATNSDDPFGIGAFIMGCVIIPFTMVFLWKNEKKIVTYARVMDKAAK